jgi:LPS sulfotransferase NodH
MTSGSGPRRNAGAGDRETEAHRPAVFIVFGHQRTGTTLLVSRLDSHPEIRCHEEVLLPWVVNSSPLMRDWLEVRSRPQWLRVVPSVRASFLASLVKDASMHGNFAAVGFKVTYNQISLWPKLAYLVPPVSFLLPDPALRSWLRSNRALVIHVLRRNHLKILVSHALAARSGRFHSRNPVVKDEKIWISLRSLKLRLDRIALAESVARKVISGLPSIEIYYEDYTCGGGRADDVRLCKALGLNLPVSGLSSPLEKLSPGNIRDNVANYDEVARYLAGTRFECFLE